MSLPKIFIGSPVEGLPIADGIETNLQHDCTSFKWSNVFQAGLSNLENILNELDDSDFAAMVLSPDDILKLRDSVYQVARDNVIFELGLFMGALGRERTFIITPQGNSGFKLPSDLDGIGTLNYNDKQDNYKIKTSIVCNDIRDRVRKIGKKSVINYFDSEKSKGNVIKQPSTLVELIYFSKVRYQIIQKLIEKFLNNEFESITSLCQSLKIKSRFLVVEVINELNAGRYLNQYRKDKRLTFKLNQKGYETLKEI